MYYDWNNLSSIEAMLGKVFTEVRTIIDDGNDVLTFTCEDGEFKMTHRQDCCEHVYIESIVGDLQDLVGNPILLAEAPSSRDVPGLGYGSGEHFCEDESFTWTFYKLATIKGYVDIRWYGSSNGYYGEEVDIYFFPKEQEDA